MARSCIGRAILFPDGAAEKIWIYGLSILNRTDQNWQNVAEILENHFIELKADIEKAVLTKGHVFWEDLRRELAQLQKRSDAQLSVHV